jgi:lipopolysaccharide export system protein LptA
MKIHRMIPVIAACAVVGFASQALGRQQASQKPETPAQKSAPATSDTWTIQFLNGISQDNKTGKGQAKAVTATSDEGTVIVTDVWQWDEKAKTAKATGNLKMTDPQADATSDQANVFYKRDKRLLVLTGNVVIFVKPKQDSQAASPAGATPTGPAPVVLQDGKLTARTGPQPTANKEDEESPNSARKHPATITCDKVEYEYGRNKKHAVLTGNFKVVQKLSDSVRTLTADHGEWFGNDERIELYPPVHFEDTKGRKGDTESKVTIHTREGEETFSVPGKGVVVIKNLPEEDEEETTPPAPKPSPVDKDRTKKPSP